MRFLFSKIPHKVIIQNFFLWLISLLIVILSFQSDASNIWVTLSLVGLIALSVDNEFIFFPCFFECLPSFVEYQIHACSVAQTSLILWDTMDCGPPGSSVHGIPRQEYWDGQPFSSSGDLSEPVIELKSPALVGRFSTAEPAGKPLNIR